ncbi:MAG: glutamate-1-semialdehyde 2,1-aminomutase [Deltaproteobacteria bacterium]|nr:glutamate-1-semialdehyde 2,1-aminomutase [Deltaproteobacteria bacterium]
MRTTESERLFSQATQLMPGGVSSPVRAFKGVGGTPLFIKKAKGPHLWDTDGNRYIDYVGSWGPMILGHNHPFVIKKVKQALKRGTSFGTPTESEITLATLVQEAFPSIQKIRFVNSGTEAVMGALRVARAFTKRKKIIKFDGCYHGHADTLLVKAGSGAATLGIPNSAGVPEEFVQNTLIARYNDIAGVEELFQKNPGAIAAVIIEPIVGNMGVILPRLDFLKKLRELCDREKNLLIFDEVMTGFRVAFGGVQQLYNIRPDLTTLGKIIGGGFPVGAYGGKKEIMQLVAPEGPVYQAGTLSGNPIAMAAGIATLEALKKLNPYESLSQKTQILTKGFKEAASRYGIPVTVERAGSMFTIFFSAGPITNAEEVRRSDTQKFSRFFHAMLDQGVYLPPSPFEAAFVSISHSEWEISKTLDSAEKAFQAL